MKRVMITAALLFLPLACGGDDADTLGIGAECTSNDQCADGQTCLTQFKGNYCGLASCASTADCPGSSACVTHTDNNNYCFRTCTDKAQCNANRSVANEANCSSNITFASGQKEGKACVPPSN